ncbi:hypothetical protein [Arhodomonas sp. AD133]|uniref:hypothetical protein n=1 Tax=Arhodomonas sp. AD133 TaxID=3415009 RepID=UPI003EB87075
MTAYLPAFEVTDDIEEALESGTLRVQTGQWVCRKTFYGGDHKGRVKQFCHGGPKRARCHVSRFLVGRQSRPHAGAA